MAIAVVALLAVKINKFGFVCNSEIREEGNRFLHLLCRVDNAERRGVPDALKRVYLAAVATCTLNKVMLGTDKAVFYVHLVKNNLFYTVLFVRFSVAKLWKIKGKIGRSSFLVSRL